jgi:LuxR family transcriptional regulator, quorum-sensing system regulator BjaR1
MLHRNLSLLSKADALQLLAIADRCLRISCPDEFTELFELLSALIPIEGASASLADLCSDLSIAKLTPQVQFNFPAGWRKAYYSMGLVKGDPIALYLFRTDTPIFWCDIRSQVNSDAARRFYRIAAKHGLVNGFSFGVRYPGSGRASFFTFLSKVMTAPSERDRLIVSVAMSHLHAALGRIHFGRTDRSPTLNENELKVLTCVRRGKTNSEIAVQLDLNPRNVKFFVESATKKLNAATRSEAVAQAILHRLID